MSTLRNTLTKNISNMTLQLKNDNTKIVDKVQNNISKYVTQIKNI